jgi:hypothetical protein
VSQPNPATCLCSSTQSFHWLLEWNSQPLAVHLLCISCHFVIGHMQCNHAENSLKPLWLNRANSGPSHGPWTAQGNVRSGIGWALIAFMDLYGIYDIYGILWHFMAFYGSQMFPTSVDVNGDGGHSPTWIVHLSSPSSPHHSHHSHLLVTQPTLLPLLSLPGAPPDRFDRDARICACQALRPTYKAW